MYSLKKISTGVSKFGKELTNKHRTYKNDFQISKDNKDLTKTIIASLGTNPKTNKIYTQKTVKPILDNEIKNIKAEIEELTQYYNPDYHGIRVDSMWSDFTTKLQFANIAYKKKWKALALDDYTEALTILEDLFIINSVEQEGYRADYYNPEFKKIADKIKLKREIKQAEHDYAPDGEKYLETKQHFEELQKKGGKKFKTRKHKSHKQKTYKKIK
tara:strand:+ start:1081 stop:1725 length:645 start_codon:yes stop_codon:yes gene_type:complete